MNFEFTRKFDKQTDKIKDDKVVTALRKVVETVSNAEQLSEIPNIKKLQGYSDHYRIRVGNYRIGFKVENNVIYFAAFDHRKDIYKNFP